MRSYGINTQAEVIATGLQAHSFTEADGDAFRQQYAIDVARPVLLYVGRVAFEKNIHFLLKVVKQLSEFMPEVLFVITGEGPAEASLHAALSTLDIEDNVQFIGYLNREKELNAC